MAQSYGMITIVDNTDLGQLSFYLTGNTLKQQTHDVNTGNYFPNWSQSNPFIVSPNVFYNGVSIDETTDSRIYSITWYHTSIDQNNKITSTLTTAAEYISGKTLKRTTNLNANGRKYIAELKFRPIANDSSLEMTITAELELSYSEYGTDGSPAKSLQLSGSGSNFIYQYTGDLINDTPITMTARSQNIAGIFWYCDNSPIYVDSSGNPTLDSNNNNNSRYINSTLTITGKTTQGYVPINNLSPNFSSNKEATFKVVETANGSEVLNGFEDYFPIYKIDEASPGTSTYTAYLDNDSEPINVYNNIPDFTNAISTLYIEKGGVNDIDNWAISVSGTTGLTFSLSNGSNNAGPYKNKVTITGMTSNVGQITFTATKNYELSEDVTVDLNKQYYTRSISNNTYVYTQVVSPSGNPSTNNYYEQISQVQLIKKFSLSKNPSLISHSLRLSAFNVNKTTTNEYSPSQVVISAITRTGGSGTEDYTGTNSLTYIIYPVDGDSVTKTGTPPLTLNLATLKDNNNNEIGPISYIEVFLGGTSNNSYSDAEDRQTITTSLNGSDGIDSWQINLKQSFDAIQTSIDYKAKTTATYEIPFEVFKGIANQNVHRYYSSNPVYPAVQVSSGNTTINGLLKYYNSDSEVSSGSGIVNKIKFTLTGDSTSIGQGGTVTLTFYIDSTHSVEKTYTYKSIPEVVGSIDLRIQADPSDTFESQSGINYARAYVLNGTTDITTYTNTSNPIYVTNFKWYYYDNSSSSWKTIKNSGTAASGEYVSAYVQTGRFNNGNFVPVNNNSNNSNILQVGGEAINGVGTFKLEVSLSINNESKTYSEIISFKDISDPIQVDVQSTLGLQLINGQGVGAIYVRATMDNEEIDAVVSDNFLGAGITAPTGSENNPPYTGKTGWIYFNPNDNYKVTYYYRTTAAASGNGTIWQQKNSYNGSYQWSFRDSNNEPITSSTIADGGMHENVHSSIKYLVLKSNTYKPQFIYLDKNVVDKKITATVCVTKN